MGDPTDHNSVVVVLDSRRVMEAWPSGARLRSLSIYSNHYVVYGWPRTLTGEQSRALVTAARSLDGARYGVADYVAARLHGGCLRRLVHRRMSNPRRFFPARFAAETYRRAGLAALVPDVAAPTLAQFGDLFINGDWEMRVPAIQYA